MTAKWINLAVAGYREGQLRRNQPGAGNLK